MADITKDTVYYLEALVTDNSGDPVEGLTVNYEIYTSATNTLINSGSLTELGDGIYQGNYTFTVLGQHRIVYRVPSPYSDEIETVNVVSGTSADINDKLLRILGLNQENFRIFNPVYNTANDLISGIIKIYSSPSDVDSDTNPVAIYEVKTTYGTGKNRRLVSGYQVKRIA